MTASSEQSTPASMVPWHGGDSAPADWDQDKPVLRRCGAVNRVAPGVPTAWVHDDFPESDIIAYTPRTTPTTEAGVAQVEAVPNGERDPAWAAIPRAIDQFVGRVPVVTKHQAVHNKHIAETVARLDEAGDRAAADTIVWLCWFSALDRERERFLNDHNAEATASLRAENDRLKAESEMLQQALAEAIVICAKHTPGGIEHLRATLSHAEEGRS